MRPVLFRLLPLVLASLLFAACGGSTPKPSTPTSTGPTVAFDITTGLTGIAGLEIHENVLPTAIVGMPFGYGFQTNVSVSGVQGKAPVTFQVADATALPPGMQFSSTGVLSGTPTTPGRFSFKLTAVDSSSTPKTATQGYTISVRNPGAQLTTVAHTTLDGAGQNGQVAVAGHFAYVGTLGSPASCPATGVRILDLSNPVAPSSVTAVAKVSGAQQRNPHVFQGLSSSKFHAGSSGDILAVPLMPCDPNASSSTEEGVAFYDVTNPAQPVALGTWQSSAPGVADVALLEANSTIYALVSIPTPETVPTASAPKPSGNLLVLDLTDPSAPVQVGSWNLLVALQLTQSTNPSGSGYYQPMGQDQRVFPDSIRLGALRADGSRDAYVTYWDQGVAILNVADPTKLANSNSAVVVSHIVYPTTQPAAAATSTTSAVFSLPEGNTHLALPIKSETDLLIADDVCLSQKDAKGVSFNPAVKVVCGAANDNDLTTLDTWGFVRTYTLNSASQASVESFQVTPQSVSSPPPDNGIYTAYDLATDNDPVHPHGFVAWYSSGLVDLDLTSTNPPNILAIFTPPDTADPAGTGPANNPAKALVVGVAAYQSGGNRYVLASDVNSGLWIEQEQPAPQFTLLTTSLPNGNENVPYSVQLATSSSPTGIAPNFTIADAKQLPSGVSLASTGLISGTPLQTGTFHPIITADDGSGDVVSQTYTFTIAQTLAIVPPTTTKATLNESSSTTLQAVNGTGTLTWALASGSLPAGMTLSSAGVLSGTPTAAGSSSFTVKVTDSAATPATATLPISFTVQPLTVSTGSLPDAFVGASYSQTIVMSNGASPFTAAVTSGSLPAGLTLSSASGQDAATITGTPTTAGPATFTITVTDADKNTATATYTLKVDAFAISVSALPNGVVNAGYSFTLPVSGGTSPYTFSLASGSLPAGLNLDASKGVLSGVPTAAGSSTFSIKVTDKNSLTTTQQFTLQVTQIGFSSPATLPAGTVGSAYSYTLQVQNGVAPYTFSVSSSQLPAGLQLNANTGAITGTPTTAGTATFTASVTDSSQQSGSQQFTLTVN